MSYLVPFVLVSFSPFSIAIISLGAFRTFARFVLVWFCLFPLPLGVWEGLRFVIVALPGLFSYLFFNHSAWSGDIMETIQDYLFDLPKIKRMLWVLIRIASSRRF